MAEYDLPASLAHALAVSNASTLAYVGHSQGTSIAFAALASQPALAAKVQAPRHVSSTVHLLINVCKYSLAHKRSVHAPDNP